ncbi:hypothetical protein BpHYR1_040264 [Brachionus plicatilis]|uniref:Uncharacterized protein n=1 Tax=Brachionus plicatilis TaxID=10195 RepID=A0A3M7RS11_BRAPC|nr:hypothetical protein BpHYR1_040264 [Brachionus plicatilis]
MFFSSLKLKITLHFKPSTTLRVRMKEFVKIVRAKLTFTYHSEINTLLNSEILGDFMIKKGILVNDK